MTILERFEKIIKNVSMPVVLECGACDSYHSDLMLKVIKQVERPFIFHCFEPNEDLHLSILNNLKGHLMFNDGVIGIYPHAIGSTVGEMTFYKSGGQKIEKRKVVDNYYGSSSIREPKIVKESFPSMTFSETKVFVTTLDRHTQIHLPGKKIDFIWSDIQGAEIDLIKGARQTLLRTRYLYTEYSNSEDYAGQAIGVQGILDLLPNFEVVEDYSGDVLLKNLTL